MGEPAGIGGEITLKAWAARKPTTPAFFIIDDAARLKVLAAQFNIPCPVEIITAPQQAGGVFPRALPVLAPTTPLAAPVTLGTPSEASAAAVVGAIDQAVALVTSGAAAGMTTNPIHKASLQSAGFGFPGHTEYLGHLAGGLESVMMLAVEGLRVVPVTVHLAMKDVAKGLTTAAIVHCGRVTAAALKTDFGIAHPRLAVAALNPHAGEKGNMGDEESAVIVPAVKQLQAEGIDAQGPAPADTLFHAAARTRFDAALCMYHDQALIPLKTIDFAGGVNVTLGLPFVRTSPDHGTAFDIAARGIADPSSLLAAIHMAADIARRRGH
ncbi:MAG: 4-hydroxythreonine-4-phosphate dehydrogenase PdxA [Rhodospirillaceae bacterium]|nr:4-hydroxythreonine-4-phosphate dehydrogenase PdxA [Rhodospirillaceae bacterium]